MCGVRSVVILGSTGSIGRQALRVVEASEGDLRVVGLAAGRSWEEVVDAARRHGVERLALADPDAARAARGQVEAEVLEGPRAAAELAAAADADLVLNGVVGAAGLEPSLAALESGKDLALANKESLV